jgi:putative sugar O-methyltransferase
MLPALVSSAASGGTDELRVRYDRATQLLMYAFNLPIWLLVFFGRDLLLLITSDLTAERTAPILSILAVGFLLNAAASLAYTATVATGNVSLPIRFNLIAVAGYVPTLAVATLTLGPVGAALAWLLLNTYYLAAMVPVVHRDIVRTSTRTWLTRNLLPFVGGGLICFGTAWGMASVFGKGGVLTAGAAVLGATVYLVVGFYRLHPAVRDEIEVSLRRLRAAWNRSPSRHDNRLIIDEHLDGLVHDMGAEVESGPSIYRPSRFWETLNSINAAQLQDPGFGSFKRTINQNYFNWLVARPWDPQYRSLIADWLGHPTLRVGTARLIRGADVEVTEARYQALRSPMVRLGYAIFVAMLWERVRRIDRLGLLSRLREPSLGDPILVRHGGQAVSQDIANSVLEFYAIEEAFPQGIPRNATVVELGAGYGRLGWLLLSVRPDVRYIVVDIPPALAIAQEYLTRLFPDLSTVRFQRGIRHLDPAMRDVRLAFLTPNQLDAMPSLQADLFINVSSLHEMRPDQIAHYLSVVKQHTRGIFYMKQWQGWTNPRDGVTIREADYPIPVGWQKVYERPHPVQTHFFEAAYRVNSLIPASR